MVENHEKGLPVRYPEFATRVRLAMKNSKKTVNDIKTGLSITYEMARRYSLGQAMPRAEKMAALAKLLKVQTSDLAYGSDDEAANEQAGLRPVTLPTVESFDEPTIDEAIKFLSTLKKLNKSDRADALSFMENLIDLSAVDQKVGTSNDTQ